MNMRRIYLLALVFLSFLPDLTTAQQLGSQSVSVEELRNHLAIIASDSLAGRGLSTKIPGLDYASAYLVQQATKTGLQPGADGYTQEFNIVRSKPKHNKTQLSVFQNDKKVVQTDSIISLTRGLPSQTAEGQVVFAGFGWQNEQSGSNDWNTPDVTGKIALISVGTPKTEKNTAAGRWNSEREARKVEQAAEKGAKAVILVTEVKDSENHTYNRIKRMLNRPTYVLKKGSAFEKIPVILITPSVATKILGINYRDCFSLEKDGKKLDAVSQGTRRIQLKIEMEVESVPVKNVVGIVEGSDALLKNECVVFMAHYDHLGTNNRGEIFNGADDNGSGTAALLEIADAFMSLEKKPGRSVVFVWVTAEEVGLLGSEYYAKHPLFPMNQTVACINLDMVGRVYEPRDSVYRKSPKQVKDFDGIYTLISDFAPGLEVVTDSVAAELGLVPDKSLPNYFFRSSDHHHFHSRDVPILNLATGYHADYHKVSDEISKINFGKLKRVTEMAFLVGLELANENSKTKNTTK